ncbi:hypothetical protein EYZ11_011106 [Aspergillus tanneri]|uniref:Uncharacterized protein n=1 Tax=Aspergillus tanneri TaxID=1220188 RepID=A0A4S3J938_9EURO|nr:hypothetical protein EYZ11_011106 [Aspergillus tanneri]
MARTRYTVGKLSSFVPLTFFMILPKTLLVRDEITAPTGSYGDFDLDDCNPEIMDEEFPLNFKHRMVVEKVLFEGFSLAEHIFIHLGCNRRFSASWAKAARERVRF